MTGIQYVRIVQAEGQIEPSTWSEVITNDPDLEPLSSIPGRDPRTMEAIQVPAPCSARWVGHPDGVPFYFRFDDGTIVIGNTDSQGVAKAESVASLLGANVEVTDD